jgi:cysteine desulfurase
MNRVHLDHNATTPLRPEVRELWLRELDALGGNPSAVHAAGRRARAVIDEARERVAAVLEVREEEVIFTSGGTESNNLALVGSLAQSEPPAGLLTTPLEHPSVLETARSLEEVGYRLTLAPVDGAGRIDAEEVVRLAVQEGVQLVSVMAANNEIGVVSPLEALGEGFARLGDKRPRFHVDAVQLLGRLPFRPGAWGAELISLSAHKVGGPLGVGVLIARGNTPLAPVLTGGGQESGLRSGTENAPALAAAALAIELAVSERASYAEAVGQLTRDLWNAIESDFPNARLLGPPIDAADRLPNTINVLFPGVEGRALVARLDIAGLEASAGSACASGSLEASHVLLALGLDETSARAGLRLSLGRNTCSQDVHSAVDILRKNIASQPASS